MLRKAKSSERAKLKVVGHRGARGLAPENTLAAIHKGLEHNVDEIEIDVRVTIDQVVILHHDLHLVDQAGSSFNVRHHTYAELKQHKPDLATLQQAIENINRTVPLQVEVKRGEAVAPIVKVIKKYLAKGWKDTDFLLSSKSQKTLTELHQSAPEIPIVVIEASSGIIARWRSDQLNSRRVSMGQRWLWDGFIRLAGRSKYELYVYTLDDPSKAKRWNKLGMTGVITDRPDLFDKQNHHNHKDAA